MVVLLAVWQHTISDNKRLGTLEMFRNISKAGVESKVWEWHASARGNDDGGSWDWVYNASKDWVEIELRSNLREKTVVAILRSSDQWKGSKIPPSEPWFQGSSFTNTLRYTDPNGTLHLLGWEPLK